MSTRGRGGRGGRGGGRSGISANINGRIQEDSPLPQTIEEQQIPPLQQQTPLYVSARGGRGGRGGRSGGRGGIHVNINSRIQEDSPESQSNPIEEQITPLPLQQTPLSGGTRGGRGGRGGGRGGKGGGRGGIHANINGRIQEDFPTLQPNSIKDQQLTPSTLPTNSNLPLNNSQSNTFDTPIIDNLNKQKQISKIESADQTKDITNSIKEENKDSSPTITKKIENVSSLFVPNQISPIICQRKVMIRDDDVENVAKAPNSKKTISSRPTQVLTNFYPIKLEDDTKIYQYHVEFQPEVVSREEKRKLIKNIPFSGFSYNYDGSSMLFTSSLLKQLSFSINSYKINFKLTKVLDGLNNNCIQVINVKLKNIYNSMKLSMIGRNYYTQTNKKVIEKHNIEILKGFSSSVSLTEKGLMLKVDTTSKVIRKKTALETIKSLKYITTQCENELLSSIVLTMYNNKTYRVSSIDWKGRVTDLMDGKITYLEYYSKNYPKSKITDLNQPLLKVVVRFGGKKQTISLIPELCYLTGVSEEMRKDFRLMKEIIEQSNLEPKERYSVLDGFIKSLNQNQEKKKDFKDWSISYQQSLAVNGVVLDSPKQILNKDQPQSLKSIKWGFIIDKKDFELNIHNLNTFIQISGLSNPTVIHPNIPKNFRDIKSQIYTDVMEEYVKKGFQFFLIVIPNGVPEVYKGIKTKSLVEFQVNTQCILLKTFEKGKPVSLKLKNQVLAKLKYQPWSLGKVVHKGIPKKTMLVGIDVGHNSDIRGHSVVGFVASLNDSFTIYHSKGYIQERPGKEIIETLANATKEALNEYYKYNNCLPDLVIVYRDGVGDGMLDLVNKHEISEMNRAFFETPSIYGPKPKLIYCVVKKNTNARFFSNDGKFNNPECGTLIDCDITKPNWYDFYLVSQVTFKGSVNPTHYHVLYDNSAIPSDCFQNFSFHMCHLYFNFEKSVRVPAPCQYAHHLAFFTGRIVNKNIPNKLSEYLYYL